MAATSFAWFYVVFSTSTGNANNFARYIGVAAHPHGYLSEWLQKYIACWVVVGICILHYRLVNIGIWANNILASFKVMAVLLFLLIGFCGGILDKARSKKPIQGTSDFGHTRDTKTAPVNITLALFLVLYSYQGWENASKSVWRRWEATGLPGTNIDYVTAEIKGDDTEKKRTLKKGALIAVAVVSALYIFLNLIMVSDGTIGPDLDKRDNLFLARNQHFWQFIVLSLDDILGHQDFTVVYNLMIEVRQRFPYAQVIL